MKLLSSVYSLLLIVLLVSTGFAVGQDDQTSDQTNDLVEDYTNIEEYYEDSKESSENERVMYGTPAEPSDFPSVVNIVTYDDTKQTSKYICAGSVIHPKWIVTEQACINLIDEGGGINYIRIRLYKFDGEGANGKPDESEQGSFRVTQKILYPSFGGGRSDLNNVMVLQIKGSFGNGAVAKVQAPRYDSEAGEGVIFGWGRTGTGARETLLKKTGLIDWQGGCINDTYTGSLLMEKAQKQLLCTDFSLVEAGHECSAAGGGPLVYAPDKILVGFISTPTCDAGSEKYMRVSYFVPWIEQVIGAKLQKMDPASRTGGNKGTSLKQGAFGALWLLGFLVLLKA